MDKKHLTIALICGGIVVVLIIILVACSFGTVEPTEWGLLYNSLSKSIKNGTSKMS